MMVAGLARSRTNAEAEKAALAEAGSSLVGVRDRLTRLADTDAEAFDQVMTAYRLPKATDEEKALRKTAIQDALHVASTAPLDVVRATREAIALARPVAANGNRSAVSDVRVALELLEAAAAGAAANVEINIISLDDEIVPPGRGRRDRRADERHHGRRCGRTRHRSRPECVLLLVVGQRLDRLDRHGDVVDLVVHVHAGYEVQCFGVRSET